MMQGKQAKIVSLIQERAILGYLLTTRSPTRDRVMLLLSMKAGLRAKAMASLTWAMVTDAAGQVAEVLHVPNRARKGHIPPNYVVGHVTAQRKPPEVRICRLRNQSRVGTLPPSTSTPHWPAC